MIIKQYESHNTVYTNYKKGQKEYWHCQFQDTNHPVNRKYFKISGQPIEENEDV